MMTPSQELFHHWGHSDISPWSADGTLMLSQRVDVTNMQDFMKGNTAVMPPQLGFVNFSAGRRLNSNSMKCLKGYASSADPIVLIARH